MDKNNIFLDLKVKLNKVLTHLDHKINILNVYRLTPNILDGIKVNICGNNVRIKQVASITILDSQVLCVKPWNNNYTPIIYKSLIKCNLGFTVVYSVDKIKIVAPVLSRERRVKLINIVNKYRENSRVSIRTIRKDTLKIIQCFKKDNVISCDENYKLHQDLQVIINNYIDLVDSRTKEKSNEITKT